MTKAQWHQVWNLYRTAKELPDEKAESYLAAATSDPEIREQVILLLEEPVTEFPNAAELPAETRIGRYEIDRLIGRGSTGDVYSGRDSELGRRVALKFLTPDIASGDSAMRRFIREAQAASALNHPNIVTVHEVVTWESSPVIVMELVEGAALRTMCGAPMPVACAVRIGSQILQALAYAHANGIVHRDLKPENIMVRPDGYVKVLDFGLARQTFMASGLQHVSSHAGLPVGTLRYMSPEQCRGDTATPASDVFAAGIILYEMIAGRHPFDADSPLDTAHAIAWSDPAPLRQWNPEVPSPTGALITRMLSKEPAVRPLSAAAAEALAIDRQSAGGRRSRRSLVFAAVLTIVLINVALAAYWLRRPTLAVNSTSDLRITPLASLLGAERHPSVSPDGTRVAFVYTGDKDVKSHIYVKNLYDGTLVRLTASELPDFQPVFSPDGTRLVFLRAFNGRLRIMVMRSAGGMERQVAEVTDLLREFAMITWDGDGRNLLVCDRPVEFRPEVAIFQISVETGGRRQLTFPPAGMNDWMPSVSPDGRTLGFARMLETSRGDLWAIPLADKESRGRNRERRLTNSGEVFFCWSWAANGDELLIAYRRSDRVQLWRQPAGGGTQVRVAGLEDQVKELAVARTGNVMVYDSGAAEDYNIWWYPLPPSKALRKPLIASAAFDGDARYSPDGSRIAFVSDRSGQANIWICKSDGSDVRQMTSLDGRGFWAGSPAWSPDGKWIAFDSRSPQTESSIFVLDVSGGKPRRLTGPGPTDIIPNWSRDSQWIYFASDRGGSGLEVWKVALSGEEPVQVTRKGGLEAFESPDGRFLYYTKRGRKSGFWRIPLVAGMPGEKAGGEESPVPGLESISNRYWENSAEGIYFVARSAQPALRLFHFSSGEISKTMDLTVPPALSFHGLSISPDGRGFLYLHADVGRSNIMLVESFR